MNDRERLIELLRKVQDYGIKHTSEEWSVTVECKDNKNIADYLLAHGVTVQEWIPVTERLPTREDANPNESVLAIAKQDGFGRTWIWEIVAEYPQEFTHWQSFPQPPKEEA